MNTREIITFLTFFLLTRCCFAQVLDNFSDGDFTSNPAWTGDVSKFAVSSGKLRLLAPAVSETAFLSLPSSAVNGTSWEFYLQLDFNTSSTNYAKIYLVSDQPNLNAALDGYFIKAGNTTDEISLYRQNGVVETEIIDGLDARIDLPVAMMKIKVTRDGTGVWQLFSDVGPSGVYSMEGSVSDKAFTASSYFGIQCTYTSTRSDKFWFDDFAVSGTGIDTTPPTIEKVTVVSQQQINILFSEVVESLSAQKTINFSVLNLGYPASAVLQADQKTVQLNFSAFLTNGITYSLQVANVKDLSANVMSQATQNILFFKEGPLRNKDVIFTEIFTDPSPQIGLPNVEFIEIYNRSQSPFNLSGWKLSDGNSTGIFPSQIILPGEYWIVTAVSSVNLLAGFGRTIGLPGFPTLNNDGEAITLKNAINLTLDSVNYSLDWYHDTEKQEGGWTMELIDVNNPCGEQDNWTASENLKGGTPGKQNSVFASKPDLTSPRVQSIFPKSSSRLVLDFDEKLDPSSVASVNFTILPSAPVYKTSFTDMSLRTVEIELQDLIGHQQYTLEVKNVRDCNGNMIVPAAFNFGLVEKADSLDVVVNEILFNPRSGGVDFVEMYNSSSKYINLRNWKVGNFENGIPTHATTLISKNQLLPPGGFAVFTPNPFVIMAQYPKSVEQNLCKVPIPGFSDDMGSVVFLDEAGRVVDELSYSKDWHSEFVKDDDGVSLERIDIRASSNDRNNWSSASSREGFATPGYANSQSRIKDELSKGDVLITPEIFSPGAGANDFVQIQYHFDQGGWVANVTVYDQQEHILKTIANNETLGPEGFFRWDGGRDDGSKVRMGYYAIYFEVFNSNGSVMTFRKRVVVSSR